MKKNNNEKIFKDSKKTQKMLIELEKEPKIFEIVIGKILGDGYLRKEGYLEIQHGIKQKEYIEHCYEELKNYTRSGIKQYFNKRHGKINELLCINTCTIFKKYLPLFYKYDEKTNKRIKIIPPNMYELLTPRVLAYWIMDDGYHQCGLYLCTHSFTHEEVSFLLTILQTKFKLNCNIAKHKIKDTEKYWYLIYIKSESMPLLWKLVGEYIIPSMKYKFGKYAI